MTDLAHFARAVDSLRRVPLTAAEEALLAFSFRDRPLFRMGCDAHVRQWDKAMRRRVWRAYWTSKRFAQAYDARVSVSREARHA
jgi:hypothetical protein